MKHQHAQMMKELVRDGMTQADVLEWLGKSYGREYAPFIKEARTQTNDELEIDDHPLISDARNEPDREFGGVWVGAWIWVANSEVKR